MGCYRSLLSHSRRPLGYSLGAVGLFSRTAEIARLGHTLLDGGRYRGRPLVSAAYVAALTTDAISTDGHVATGGAGPRPQNATYGRHVWLCDRDGAWADGRDLWTVLSS